MRDLAEEVLRLTGSKSRIIHLPAPVDDPAQRRPDISRAAALTGWQPTTPLSEGLKRTIAFFRHSLNENQTLRGDAPVRV